jgi:hypothetical protein
MMQQKTKATNMSCRGPLRKRKRDIDYVNNRIKKELCKETLDALEYSNLVNTFKKYPSVINRVNKLAGILTRRNISDEDQNAIIDEFIMEIVPAGTKGKIRGHLFNKIVEKKIKEMSFPQSFEISFEKKHPSAPTHEIPDWVIYDNYSQKILIGMNQLDLWKGGHQFNRGSKYIFDSKNTKEKKLICVVCNNVTVKSKNKTYKIISQGFKNNTLCYLNNLENIINDFFNMID